MLTQIKTRTTEKLESTPSRLWPVTVRRVTSNPKLVRTVQTPTRGKSRTEPQTGSGTVTTTAIPIRDTCPTACPMKGGRCYVLRGIQARNNRRLETLAQGWTPLDIVRAEVEMVRQVFRRGVPHGQMLRLHEYGDATTSEQAEQLAGLAAWWLDEGGGPVWTYTHSWRTIPRSAWGPISVRASVHARADIFVAKAQGYALALVVPTLPRDGKSFVVVPTDVRVVPCPAETRHIPCSECQLCMREHAHIAFEEHGRVATKGIG